VPEEGRSRWNGERPNASPDARKNAEKIRARAAMGGTIFLVSKKTGPMVAGPEREAGKDRPHLDENRLAR
jgi:hypothetical protein